MVLKIDFYESLIISYFINFSVKCVGHTEEKKLSDQRIRKVDYRGANARLKVHYTKQNNN